jgi:putative pyruvate formate lyase activating enzyme
MPGALEQTRAVMRFLVREVSPNVYVNVMDQYGPAGKVGGARYPELDRLPRRGELREAVAIAVEEGVRRLDRRRPHPLLMAGRGT